MHPAEKELGGKKRKRGGKVEGHSRHGSANRPGKGAKRAEGGSTPPIPPGAMNFLRRSAGNDGVPMDALNKRRGVDLPVLRGGRAEGGRLTAADRQALPKGDFALPGKGNGPKGAGSGSYPIPDESHARNALARVSQHGSPAEKAKVRAAVHRKFPDIDED